MRNRKKSQSCWRGVGGWRPEGQRWGLVGGVSLRAAWSQQRDFRRGMPAVFQRTFLGLAWRRVSEALGVEGPTWANS